MFGNWCKNLCHIVVNAARRIGVSYSLFFCATILLFMYAFIAPSFLIILVLFILFLALLSINLL